MNHEPVLALPAMLAIAVFFDLRDRRIPNLLVGTGLLAALWVSLVSSGVGGVLQCLGGAGVGFAMFVPFYALGGMAAGDVKLMAATGAFLGVDVAFAAAVLALLAGGAIALLAYVFHATRLAVRCDVSPLADRVVHGVVAAKSATVALPYAVAIAAGTLAALALGN